MHYRQLGRAGVRVSAIGLGTNRFGTERTPLEETVRIIDAAEEAGINLLDTANVYAYGESEKAIGKALKGRRDRFVLATKFSMSVGDGPNERGGSRVHLERELHRSLRRLGTDRIDLYYLHRWDDSTPIEETLSALDEAVRAGKICYVGVSDLAAWQLAHAKLLADLKSWAPLAVIQSHYHLLERAVETEVLPYCRWSGVGFVPYFPLAGGFLTGKYRADSPPPPGSRGEKSGYVQQYMTPANYAIVSRLAEWAKKHGRNVQELAQAWLLAQPQVCSVISGVTSVEQLQANVKAHDWQLSAEEESEVRALLI